MKKKNANGKNERKRKRVREEKRIDCVMEKQNIEKAKKTATAKKRTQNK